jgi:hypothetical protein
VRRNRSLRIVRLALVVMLALEASYIAAANAFLNLGGIQKLLASTDDVRVTYERAWTLWPGHVSVKNARILFHDHNLEWSLDAKSLDFDLAFLPLFEKTLHATRVRGEGLVFRVRLRVEAADGALSSTRALPPIPEFETPALIPAHVPGAPRTDLWKIHAEDVQVGLVEIWAQQLRYLGNARARGAFRLHAGHHLWVGPASLELEAGELRASERLLAARLFGHVDCVVHPFFVNVPFGREVFKHISANVDLHAEDVRFEPLDLFLPPGTTLSATGARFDLALTADHGVVSPESHAELHAPALRGTHLDWVFAGSAFELGARVASDGLGEATFDIQDVQASRDGKQRSGVKLGAGHLALATTSLDTSERWGLARVDAALSRLEIPSLSAFDDLAKGRGVRLDAGSAVVDASASYSGSAVSGEGRALLSKARGRARSVGWELDGSVELSLGRAETEALEAGSMKLLIAARRLAVIAAATRVEASDAHVTAHARLTDGRGAASVRTNARQLSIDGGPFRVAGKAKAEIEISAFDLSRGILRASAAGELVSLEARSGKVRARAPRLRVKSKLSLVGTELSSGWFELTAPSLSVRAGDTAISSNAQMFVEAKKLDLANRRGSALAVLLVRDLSVTDAVEAASCQWLGAAARAGLRANLGFSKQGRARLDVAADADAARARWDDFEVAGNARLKVVYQEANSDRISLDLAATKVHMTSGSSKLEGWETKLSELQVVGALRRDLWRLSGPVRVSAKQARGRIGRIPVHADVAADLRLAFLDLETGQAIGSGDVRIDRAGLDAGDVHVRNWWGRVKIPTLSVIAQENLDISGEFRAELRDGLPALGIFAASGDLPGWVPKLLPLNQLEARGGFRRSCRTSDIVFERGSGGPLAFAGRIRSVPDATRALFLLRLKSPLALSVGLAAHDDGVGVALLAGNDWLGEQSTILDQWEPGASCKPAADSCEVDEVAVRVADAVGARNE